MKTILSLLVLLAMTPVWSAEARAPLTAVEDGDTLKVGLGGKTVRVQLAGIDAPEDRPNPKFRLDLQRTGLPRERLLALGRAATAHLREWIHPGDTLVLEGKLDARDRYGRLVAWVHTPEGRALSRAMVADGYAIALGDAGLGALQQRAMETGRGLWGLDPDAARLWAGVAGAPRKNLVQAQTQP